MVNENELQNAVKHSNSIRKVLVLLNMVPAGSNYQTIKNLIKKFNIDCSHFTGQGYLKGKTHNWAVKIPLSEILIEKSLYTNNNKLRIKLIKEGFKKYQCECCKNTEWLGKPISLELEHVNGIHTDNRIENLKLLCPNCHAQTATYRGKNKLKNRLDVVKYT